MPTEPKSKHIPRATIQRLATYVQVLENFARDGVEVISSNPLAAGSTAPRSAKTWLTSANSASAVWAIT